jgi:hypothetical protein
MLGVVGNKVLHPRLMQNRHVMNQRGRLGNFTNSLPVVENPPYTVLVRSLEHSLGPL